MKFIEWCKKNKKIMFVIIASTLFILLVVTIASKRRVYINRAYTDTKDVALYLKEYHELPPNYITKNDAENGYLPSNLAHMNKVTMIGGDTYDTNFYINTENKLKKYHITDQYHLKECDIFEPGYDYASNRLAHRLVYTSNAKRVRVFETTNHYESFDNEITKFEIMPFYYIMVIVFWSSVLGSIILVLYVYDVFKLIKMFRNDKKQTIEVETID